MILITPILILIVAAWVAWAMRHVLPSTPTRGWILALLPASSFGWLLWLVSQRGDDPLTISYPWITRLNLDFGFYFDSLAALFALLVTGIGTLIIIYAGYYFAGDKEAGRFFTYLFLFMGMMLGLVLAGNVITLFIFWEGTSITSFLLVAYKYKYESARRGAFKALFITGGGGIALLAGLLVVSSVVGSSDFATILSSGDLLRSSELYLVMLGLVGFGAFSKSAQFPVHIWLPDAMSAPTPASAFLHSATMVKAGIYLLARLNPALGNTESWFWLLSVVGLITMLLGAYLGTKQNDLKGLLAYSTISQLGILVMLIGQETEIAFKALVIGIVAHAFYKSALFMLIGTVDLSAGTRELSRLGGLRHAMPLTFPLVAVAALSLAGLPPLFGFLAKETLVASAVHPSLPTLVSWLFTAIIVVAAAFKLVQAGMLTIDLFFGETRDSAISVKRPPAGMLFGPFVPALLSLAIGILPEPKWLAIFFGEAAANSFGEPVKVSFALWTGLNLPLLVSVIAISLGLVLFWQRSRIIGWQQRIPSGQVGQIYRSLLSGIEWSGQKATRLQSGQLRLYISVILLSAFGLTVLLGGWYWPGWTLGGSVNPLRIEFDIIRLLALVMTVSAALATILIKRDFFAILAMGAAGLGIAIYMVVEPAPDVALVQIVVDILATLILVLAISRLPRQERTAAQALNRIIHWPTIIVAGLSGLLVSLISYGALVSRPRTSFVSPFYAENAKPLTGASDIVGAIIVDFRAMDTLIEIAVFSLAGLGVYTLLRYAARTHGDSGNVLDTINWERIPLAKSLGIGGAQTSYYLQVVTNMLLPAALMIGSIHMLYGHDQPGDGFTAGVIISLALGLKYVVFGFRETRRRLWWVRPQTIISFGILLVITNGVAAGLINGAFLSPLDYGEMLGLTLPAGVKLSSGFLFEVAIAMAVLGSVTLMLDTLGRPAVDVEVLQNEVESEEAVLDPTAARLAGD